MVNEAMRKISCGGAGALMASILAVSAPGSAAAISVSPGCAAFNGTSSTSVNPGANAFEMGDLLTVIATGTEPSDIQLRRETVQVGPVITAGFIGATTYTILADETVTMEVVVIAPDRGFTYSCVPAALAGGALEAQQAAAAQTAAQSGVQATTSLIGGRISSIFGARPSARPAVPTSGAQPSGGVAENLGNVTGGGGQAGADPIGVWGNFGYTGVTNSERVARSGTDVLTAVGGADILVDDFLVGGAVAFSWADTDTPDDAFLRDEFSVTFAPYAAYAIDEVFAIDASLGYTLGVSDTERTDNAGQTFTGDAVNHGYFLSLNASGRQYWDRFGLFGTMGMLWAQSFQGAYDEDGVGGQRVGSQRIDLGSLFARIQPSYLIPAGPVTFEPYFGLGYTHDYVQTEIAGTANDRGQMDARLGVNLFGQDMLGTIEANTGLFRENQRRVNINATLHLQF